MTKPDSTDAGGVTHEEARSLVRFSELVRYERAQLARYIDQCEAALATLTRECDEARRDRDTAHQRFLCEKERADQAYFERDSLARKLSAQPATPPAPLPIDYEALALTPLADEPAPLPGGQGQVTVAMLHQLFYDAPSDTFENFVCYIVNTLADRIEQGGEGREG